MKKKNPEHEQQGNRNVLNVLSLFAKLVYLSNFLNIPWHLWEKINHSSLQQILIFYISRSL